MSPKQAERRETGPPSNVFSLGAVLAFAATGTGPFGTGSTAALVYRVVHGTPALDDVPATVRLLAGRCLAKDPGQRPTTPELLAELDGAYLEAGWLPARSPPTSPARRVCPVLRVQAGDCRPSPATRRRSPPTRPGPACRPLGFPLSFTPR
jgi:eukaryotic-like serine/threonine-protein kinase